MRLRDAELLSQIEELFDAEPETPFGDDYDPLIEALSFTSRTLGNAETDELKKAWTNFLSKAFGRETSWEFPLNEGMARWYRSNGMPEHAIAVYEHLYSQILRGELVENEDQYEGWLLHLFRLCVDRGLVQRARHLAELIGDYHEIGLVGVDSYAEIVAAQWALPHREMVEVLGRDRDQAEERLRTEIGPVFDELHASTRSLIINAELWSDARLRILEPSAGPRCWALAVEAEFHHKVFDPHRAILGSVLVPPLKEGRTCGPSEIIQVLQSSASREMIKAEMVKCVFVKLRGGSDLVGIASLDALAVIREHRNQIAHITELGNYTTERCNAFLKVVRDSGWVLRFLEALQPR